MEEKREIYLKSLMWLYENNPRLARAVYLRTKYDLKLHEIGEELGVSTERARQMFYRGLNLMKIHLQKKYRIKEFAF